ncbi:MAG: DUF1273 family protein [Clostridia bacterium]|nr:DUF1273 family protein [Clostridia bacterium]
MKNDIRRIVSDLIENKGVTTFFFGSKSRFNSLCYEIVSELKELYPHIKRIYVRAEYPNINEEYRKYLSERYEEAYYPEEIENSGRAVYVKRNQHMINRCSVCVVYYKENYSPLRRKNTKKDLGEYQPKSGTKIAYNYAVKKEKKIINVVFKNELGNVKKVKSKVLTNSVF